MGKRFSSCPNCGTFLENRMEYCPTCGQKNEDYRFAFFGLIGELLQDSFNFDTQFLTTLRAFLLAPGKISAEVVAGKRKRYTPPFRLFLFSSFVVVFLLNIWANRSFESAQSSGVFQKIDEALDAEKTMDNFSQNLLVLDSIGLGKDTLQTVERLLKTNVKTQNDSIVLLAFNELRKTRVLGFRLEKRDDSLQYLAPYIREKSDTLSTHLGDLDLAINGEVSDSMTLGETKVSLETYAHWQRTQPQKIDSLYAAQGFGYWDRLKMRVQDELTFVFVHADSQEKIQYAKEHSLNFLSRISYPILALLPFSSLFLLLLFGRRRKYFYEHFVFNIHLHTAINLLNILTIAVAWGFWQWRDNSAVPIVLFVVVYTIIAPLYALFSMHHFYTENWLKLVLKFAVFSVLYVVLISFGMIIFLLIELAFL